MAANTFRQARLLKELEEVYGTLTGFEQVARDLLAVNISDRTVLLPIKLQPRLEEPRGRRIVVTLIEGKHYIRQLPPPPSAPTKEDLLQARVAELEAENERLRAAQKGLCDGRAGPCTQ